MLIHLLQSYVRQPVEVDQHFIGFLKAIKPVFKPMQQSNNYLHIGQFAESKTGIIYMQVHCSSAGKPDTFMDTYMCL